MLSGNAHRAIAEPRLLRVTNNLPNMAGLFFHVSGSAHTNAFNARIPDEASTEISSNPSQRLSLALSISSLP